MILICLSYLSSTKLSNLCERMNFSLMMCLDIYDAQIFDLSTFISTQAVPPESDCTHFTHNPCPHSIPPKKKLKWHPLMWPYVRFLERRCIIAKKLGFSYILLPSIVYHYIDFQSTIPKDCGHLCPLANYIYH